MLIDRKNKTQDVTRIARQCADNCSRLRRANEPGDRIFRRSKVQQVHISQDTLLRMPKSDRRMSSQDKAIEDSKNVVPLYRETRKIPKTYNKSYK